VGAGFMGAIYIGVGTALILADRHYWMAVLFPNVRRPGSATAPATTPPSGSSPA
jgi:hypothetical protein